MTLREAMRDRLRWLRRPIWNPTAVLELPLLDSGGYGPWAKLWDKPVQEAIGAPTPQEVPMLSLNLDEDVWVQGEEPAEVKS